MERVPEEVAIYASPWVPGFKAIFYRGLIETKDLVPWSEGQQENDAVVLGMYEELAAEARALGCNAIVGFEIAIDPFENSAGRAVMRVELSGTAVQLQPAASAGARKLANGNRVAKTASARSLRSDSEPGDQSRVPRARSVKGR